MSCEICSGSCSLCPWCGEEQCPHLHDHDNDKRYWVYATDRKKSCHVLQANLNSKKEAIDFVKKLVNKKWAKEFCWAWTAKEKTARGWKGEDEYLPWVELTITDGKYSWYNDVDLIINTDEKKIYYYNIWKTEFYDLPGERTRNVELIKEWDGKLNFTKVEELPWYPEKYKKNR